MKDRREKINNYIISKGFVTLSELSELFSEVSTMTLRRDLEYLEEAGEIIRTRGGAKSIMHLSMKKEEAYNRREFINPALKAEIGKKVSGLIEDNSCVFFDAGSTVMQVAREMGQKPLFAVTSGPNIAMELTKNKRCDISVVCGRLNPDNISLSGLHAVEFLEGLNIGTAVIASSGFTMDCGFTCGSYDECELKRAAVRLANRVIIVMDSTKLGKNHPFTFAKPSDADYFVSDDGFDKKAADKLCEIGVKVL